MSDSPDVDQYSVSDAPSVGANPNANPGSFKVPTNWIYQTIAPSGAITKDQVFTTATTDEDAFELLVAMGMPIRQKVIQTEEEVSV